MSPRRIAVVGLDHMHAGDQIAVIREADGAELVGVWDDDPERMTRLAAELGLDAALLHDDLDALLAEARPEVAVVCSTTADHRPLTERLAAASVHVLLEKPFASSIDDVHAMIAAAERGGVLLGVNWPLAWYPSHRTLHRLLREGAIGDIVEVHFYDGNRGPLFHSHGKREIDADEARAVKAGSWWYDPARGGGALRDYLGYGTTLATWFREGELPTEVTTRTHVEPGDAVDEQSVTIAAYPRGLSTFQTRWGTFTDPWTHQPAPRCGFVVVGTAGTISSGDYDDHVTVQTRAHPEGERVPVDAIPAHETGGIRALLHALDAGAPLSGPLSAATSLAGQRIVEAAARSAAEGRAVRVDEVA